jgi:hypothetical protein
VFFDVCKHHLVHIMLYCTQNQRLIAPCEKNSCFQEGGNFLKQFTVVFHFFGGGNKIVDFTRGLCESLLQPGQKTNICQIVGKMFLKKKHQVKTTFSTWKMRENVKTKSDFFLQNFNFVSWILLHDTKITKPILWYYIICTKWCQKTSNNIFLTKFNDFSNLRLSFWSLIVFIIFWGGGKTLKSE